MAKPLSDNGFSQSIIKSTAVAIGNDKRSPYAMRWAIDNLVIGNPTLMLVHVRKTGLQNQNYDYSNAPSAGGGENDADLQKLFNPYRAYCVRKGVEIKEVVLEDTDVSRALVDYINTNVIGNIVVGASTRSTIAKKFGYHDVPTLLNRAAPDFCSVYVIAKGKVQSVRQAARPAAYSAALPKQPSSRGLPPSLMDNSEPEDAARARGGQRYSGAERMRPKKSPANMSMDYIDIQSRGPSRGSSARNSLSDDINLPSALNLGSLDTTDHDLDFTIVSERRHNNASRDLEAEMMRLKLELKQTMDMYNTACKEAVSAKQKANELHSWKMEEARRFEQARLAGEAALAVAEKEKAKCKAAIEAAEKAKKIAEMEAQRRIHAEQTAKREAEEKNRALSVLSHNDVRYRKYTIEEIETATNRFADSFRIGEGGYVPVFKAKLDHTPVAIKVLRPDAAQGKKQFRQEVEVLSCIRHPNMVLLLGACPEYGCLVYEFMNNGSLEDRLFQKGNTPPIPWRIRFKIAADIATGLLFLHQTKPEPLVHRDLKPANILLDHNYVCKISDVGLARLVPPSVADSVTQYHMTSAAGTFCYIDPEYQQTGKLGTKSDIYSLGIMLLQIITARPPMGLSHRIERAIERGTFSDLLDPTVPDWPAEEALSYAKLALKCAELRKKDRPYLGTVILPELERLRDFGMDSRANSSNNNTDGQRSRNSSTYRCPQDATQEAVDPKSEEVSPK